MSHTKLILLAVLLSATICDGASIDTSKWQYVGEVTIEGAPGEYCALVLTPGIHNAARTDLADIRLIDRDGNQIPYVMMRDEDRTETVKYNPTILNRATDANGNALATLDFGGQTVKNSIEVETAGDNFRRAVKVEGSNDNVQFFTIVDRAYIFAVSDKTRHRFSTIDLPNNDYRYIRITVSPMTAEETKPAINEVRAFKIEKKPAQKQVVEMIQTEHTEDVNYHTSNYVYDLKFRRLPVVEIELNTDDASFYRCVTIQGRDAVTQKVKIDSEDNRQRFREVEVPWNTITTDVIYRYTDAAGKQYERLALPISWREAYKYIRIVVSNYDDQPITIRAASAKMVPHKVIFPAPSDKSAKLYVGNESASHPQYDLARRLTNPTHTKTTQAAIASLTDNPAAGKIRQNLPWTEQHKMLLLAVLVMVVFVLGVFMLSSVRSIQRQDGPR
ncbi:MAG: DUF3999 family protein [Sedimentisphaerales bacterium]|jgi:hypothetical protein